MNTLSIPNPFDIDRLSATRDYRPEWDVLSINESVFTSLKAKIIQLRGHEGVDPRLKIPILLGPAGYGKTHLFGRSSYHLRNVAKFIFIPQIEHVERPLPHLQWHLVEHLFEAPPGKLPFLKTLLAGLCRPSFERYFEWLPPEFTARHESLRQRLTSNRLAVVEIIDQVKELAPFHCLANSVVRSFPGLSSEVLRALVLGWSSLAYEARQWLRGEHLGENVLSDLQLGPDPPPAHRVYQTVATLLQRSQTPLVVCWDQMEAVLEDPVGRQFLTTALVNLLHEVPNLLIVLSCLKASWETKLHTEGYEAFLDRVVTYELERLTSDQAVELVERRINTWAEAKLEKGSIWPFDEHAIVSFVKNNPTYPRGFIHLCGLEFSRWLEAGKKDQQIHLGGLPPPPPVWEVFLQEWNKELMIIQKQAFSPDNQQADRLFRAVREALHLALDCKMKVGNIEFLTMQEGATRKGANDAQVGLGEGSTAFSVVLAVSKEKGGVGFGNYISALEQVCTDPVVGVVLIRPTSDLNFGQKTKAYQKYQKMVNDHKLRPFALIQHRPTFERLECLLRFLDRADKDLMLGGRLLPLNECRRLIVQTKVLENLDLFADICSNWSVQTVAGKPTPTPSILEPASVGAGTISTVTDGSGGLPGLTLPRAITTGAGEEVTSSPSRLPGIAGTGAISAGPAEEINTDATPRQGIDEPTAPLLKAPRDGKAGTEEWGKQLLDSVVHKLRIWGQPVDPLEYEIGPTFVRLKVFPHDKTDVAKVQRYAQNLAVNLSLAPQPLIGSGAGFISLDIRLSQRRTVSLAEVFQTEPSSLNGHLAFPVGMDVSGHTHWLHLADPSSCHLLVAGATGSGKSEFLKAMLAALAHRLTPQEVQFLLIDPKRVTFNFRGETPYLLRPIARTVDEALPLVQHCVDETLSRYQILESRRLENVNELKGAESLPRLVLVIDEFADLMVDKSAKKALEGHLKRISAMARAAGIHLVLATQRPEASVVTPILKANLPSSLCFHVANVRNSNLILDNPDAAHLLGKGDLIWKRGGGYIRLQSPFVGRDELETKLRI